MSDIFSPAKQSKGVSAPRKTKRVGQTLKRILALIDHPETPIAEKIKLAKMADKLARKEE